MKTSFIRVLAIIAMSSGPALSLAQWWNPSYTMVPEKFRQPVEYGPNLRLQAQAVVSDTLVAGDFAKLDRMHDEFVELHRGGGPGAGLIYVFFPALNMVYANPAMKSRLVNLFEDWRAKAPDSRLRPTAEAAYWVQVAWHARGDGFASTVTPEGWKIFRESLAKAAKVLEDGAEKGRESPLWYESALATAGALGAPARALDGIFDEGATKFAYYTPLYFTRLNYLLPKWGGDYPDIDRFIRGAVMRTQAKAGTTYYAHLYMAVLGSFKGGDFFRETPASWPLMRHAFEEEVARDDADVHQNATVACLARDRETTRRLMDQLGDKANLGRDVEGFSTEACMQLVREAR
jgi:hypothetical protein